MPFIKFSFNILFMILNFISNIKLKIKYHVK